MSELPSRTLPRPTRFRTRHVPTSADLSTTSEERTTIFSLSCTLLSSGFVRDIVDKVPKEHWTMPDKNGWTPLFVASIFNPVHRQGISRLLTLRGVPVLHDDFRGGEDRPDYLEYRRQLLRWAQDELALHHTFWALVLGCGVHGSRDVPPPRRSPLLKIRE